jgi:hypothetical protein
MSNRFYVNDVQIFGNNEMFERTYEELKKQGAEWTEDCTFGEIEITDPQALMEAVEKDSLEYLKKVCTEMVLDEEKGTYKDKNFEDVHDSDLILSVYGDTLKNRAYTDKGEVRNKAWRSIGWWLEEKRILTSWNLYQAIKNDVKFDKQENLVLKEGHEITAHMY